MKYYVIAGEASGDLHAAYLIKALQKLDAAADVRGWGGDEMIAVGADVRKHYRELAFMGFVEVLLNIRTILRNFKLCKADILAYQPDVLILVDYPGFNLRMAKWAKEQGVKVFYYISPQIWAWNTGRVHQIKAYVDEMFCILPFEQSFYQDFGVEVDYVGHPLLDVIADRPPAGDFRVRHGIANDQPLIALLPGSRKQEIERTLSVMLTTAQAYPECNFMIAGAPSQPASYYESIMARLTQNHNVELVQDETYALLRAANAALVTSGTATLETALLDCPQIVCYRGSTISYWIARRLIKVGYISLVNLIMDRSHVLELIQDDFNPRRLNKELAHLLSTEEQARQRKGYAALRKQLGSGGAAERCAKLMWDKM